MSRPKYILALLPVLIVVSLIIPLAAPVIAQSTVTSPITYSTAFSTSGVLAKDRSDYMNAAGNPLKEDIANYVFQGPGLISRSSSVGYMNDIYVDISNYGTITRINYTRNPPYWLPAIEQTPVAMAQGQTTAPVEGWAIHYNMTVYPTSVYKSVYKPDSGKLVVTTSGWKTTDPVGWTFGVIGQDKDDNWAITPSMTILVDNPRLQVVYFNITAVNNGSPYKPVFSLEIIVVFNKATKYIDIYQRLTLLSTSLPEGCYSVSMDIAMARIAIIDANPYCDRAFYGWKELSNGAFMVLSWTNATLSKWVRASEGYKYYAVYALAYPAPDAYAIASTWYNYAHEVYGLPEDTPEAANVWMADQLRYTTRSIKVGYDTIEWSYANFVYLNMGDIDNDDNGDGDQALVRFDWYTGVSSSLPENLKGITTGWKLIKYGVYDVGDHYDGGEGGEFDYVQLTLSDGTTYSAVTINGTYTSNVTSPWSHTGTLGLLNTHDTSLVTSFEDKLYKTVTRIDLNTNGTIDKNEVNIEVYWYPTEELLWQLMYNFCPSCGIDLEYLYDETDFLVMPAPGATPDAAGAAWLSQFFYPYLTLFDVEAYNMTATVGYTNPALKMLPYFMLRLENIPSTVEQYRTTGWKSGRVGHYMASDLRALPQMAGTDYGTTDWRDVHYLALSVAGIHPNLLTFYANDFSPIVRPIGGDLGPGYLVILPTPATMGDYEVSDAIIDISQYVGGKLGAGVISLVRDHFNNMYLIVYGLDAQDTYWTAYALISQWYAPDSSPIVNIPANDQAVLLLINYTAIGNMWGDGTGIPIATPTSPSIDVLVEIPVYEACEEAYYYITDGVPLVG